MTTMVIDYGLCNLGSVRRAFEECGANVIVTDKPQDLKSASRIVLPGVGAFADGMCALSGHGWAEVLREHTHVRQMPLLGICLGMQMLCSIGNEGGQHDGLDLVQGVVQRIEPTESQLRVPHVGWNELYAKKDSILLRGIPDGSDVYFVHSYHFVPQNKNTILTETPYGDRIVSSIQEDSIFGVQFHPEKSGRTGFQLLKNFLEI